MWGASIEARGAAGEVAASQACGWASASVFEEDDGPWTACEWPWVQLRGSGVVASGLGHGGARADVVVERLERASMV